MEGFDFSKIPLQPPPPGVVSNFVNPDSLSALPKVFIYVTLPPMVLFLVLRFYVRITISRKVGTDDWLSLAAALIMVPYCAVMLTFLDRPAGPHAWDIPVTKVSVEYVSRSLLLSAIYLMPAMLIKASILLLYLRLFQISTLARVMIWIGMFVNVVFYIASFCLFMVYCVPRPADNKAGGWLNLDFGQRCSIKSGPVAAASGVVGTVLDIYILIIPLFPIYTLRASLKKKIGICFLFIAGSSACVFSIVGCVYRFQIYRDAQQDITWRGMPIYAMNVGEINMGIISSSLPVIFVLFRGITAKSITWMSKLRYGRSRPSQPTGASDVEMLKYQEVDNEKLPAVPKGTLTGLKKWMRNKNRTSPVTETQVTALSTNNVLTYVSADYDYHQQLKQGLNSGSAISVQKDISTVTTANGAPQEGSGSQGSGSWAETTR